MFLVVMDVFVIGKPFKDVNPIFVSKVGLVTSLIMEYLKGTLRSALLYLRVRPGLVFTKFSYFLGSLYR
jgi:hypothetical protein